MAFETEIAKRIQAARVAYDHQRELYAGPTRWVTVGAVDHHGGTHVEIDGQGNIAKGPAGMKGNNIASLKRPASAGVPGQRPSSNAGIPGQRPASQQGMPGMRPPGQGGIPGQRAPSGQSMPGNRNAAMPLNPTQQQGQVPQRMEGESEKQWLKRIVKDIPSPAELPEQHDAYFNMDKASKVVPMSQLRSTKSDEENQQGGGNAPKFMDLARKGLAGKRDPITVQPNDQGGYDVVDGNGTFTGAKQHGWQNMPVQIAQQNQNAGQQPSSDAGGQAASQASQSPASKPFFTPEEMALPENDKSQPVAPNSGYQPLAEKGQVANHDLQVFLDFGKGIGSQLGFDTILPGTMTDEQRDARASQPGGYVMLAPVKGEKRSNEKVNEEYEGDWTKLLDIARATVAVDSIDDVHKVLQKIRESGIKFARRPKDRLTKPTKAGYRDIMTNVVMPNGVVAELQINLKPMLIAKGKGHHQYEIMRTIEGRCAKEGDGKNPRDMTEEESATYNQALKESQEIYGSAWEACTGGGQPSKYSKRIEKATFFHHIRGYA